ncbi:hypothetical protein ACA910_018729 [Epithemia clementina (nom. ined.)]
MPAEFQTEATAPTPVDQDRFIMNIRALKSLLTAANGGNSLQPTVLAPRRENGSTTNGNNSVLVADLRNQIQVLSARLEDTLQDAERERQLRSSLEKAFDELTENRKELKRQLDQVLESKKNMDSLISRNNVESRKGDGNGVTFETRLLSMEADKVEAIRLYENTQTKLSACESQLDAAQRKMQDLEAALAGQKSTMDKETTQFKAELEATQKEKHLLEKELQDSQTKLTAVTVQLSQAQGSLEEMETNHASKEKQMVEQVTESLDKLKMLEKSKKELELALEGEQKERVRLEEQLNVHLEEAEEHAIADEEVRNQLEALKAQTVGLEASVREARMECEATKAMALWIQAHLQDHHSHGDSKEEENEVMDIDNMGDDEKQRLKAELITKAFMLHSVQKTVLSLQHRLDTMNETETAAAATRVGACKQSEDDSPEVLDDEKVNENIGSFDKSNQHVESSSSAMMMDHIAGKRNRQDPPSDDDDKNNQNSSDDEPEYAVEQSSVVIANQKADDNTVDIQQVAVVMNDIQAAVATTTTATTTTTSGKEHEKKRLKETPTYCADV